MDLGQARWLTEMHKPSTFFGALAQGKVENLAPPVPQDQRPRDTISLKHHDAAPGEGRRTDGFAADARVITTGSIDSRGVRAYYSDFGPPLDLMAPSGGQDLRGLTTTDVTGDPGEVVGDYYDDYGGTSASAALVSAAAALVIAEHPSLTAAQVMEALFDNDKRDRIREEARSSAGSPT